MPPTKPVVNAIASLDSVLGTRVRLTASSWLGPEAQGVRHASPVRRGVTLVELIVVLALMALVLAIAAPAFVTPRASRDGGFAAVVATARRAAILRSEPVTLALEADGEWHIDGDASPPAATPIAAGRLTPAIGQLRVRISPLGTCIPDRPVEGSGVTWNALECRLDDGAREGSSR